MPRQLAQQRMTLSDLEWPFHASRAISTVAELVTSGKGCVCLAALHRHSLGGAVSPL